MKTSYSWKYFAVGIGLILLCFSFRLESPWPNFSPLLAVALFSGFWFRSSTLRWGLPFLVLIATDLFLGFHETMPYVYGAFAIGVFLGQSMGSSIKLNPLAGRVAAGSVLFYLITNFGVWAHSGIYPQSFEGLLACYVAALPFFKNSIAGDVFFSGALFGLAFLADRQWILLTPRKHLS